MATLKTLANVVWWLGLLASLGLLGYFAGLGLHLWPQPNGFWA
jgi:hypothetical protein